MKRILILFTGLLLAAAPPRASRAQGVGIGTSTPAAAAALDIQSTSQGLLVPRLTAAQRGAIASPPQGLMVYQTDGTAGGGPATGFWYFGGSPAAWVFINPAGGGADNLGNHTATENLKLDGFALTGTGASIGAAVGVGVRADGGLNIGQNGAGNNIFVGYQAGAATTTGSFGSGSYNQFVGYQSGKANTTGGSNHFSGYQSGKDNTTGENNHFSGYQSGYDNTTGDRNHFSGHQSGFLNTTGSYNHFSGYLSGAANRTGSYNQFSGYQSGYRNETGEQNQFSGYQSGFNNATGSANQFSGYSSGFNNTTGSRNQFSGNGSGYYNTRGSQNQFSGYKSGYSNTTGNENFFSGYQSGYDNTTGSNNTFSGYFSGYSNTTGNENFFSGYQSGYRNETGSNNTFSGYFSGISNRTGSYNTAMGYNAGPTTGNLTKAIAIGYNARVSQSNSLVLGGIGADAVNVGIGTTAPAVPLDVQSQGSTNLGSFAFYALSSTGQPYSGGASGAPGDISIRASGRMVAAEFNATSDARLKTILGRTSNAADLTLLTQLRITDYQLRDRAHYGGRRFKKVIAQEVEQVFPQAVSRQTGFLPDVYAVPTAVRPEGDSLLVLTLPAGLPEGASAGQRLRLLGPTGEVVARVARPAAAGTHTLAVRGAQALAFSQLFVFGLEHPDVRAVDYEALAMLNVSATQELARQLAALQARTAQADADHAALLRLQAQVAQLLSEAPVAAAPALPTQPPTAR